MPRQLVIKVQADGSVRVETLGIDGEECVEYAQIAEDVCAATIADRTLTADYYRRSEESAPAHEANDDFA